jgi:hypothetical protein
MRDSEDKTDRRAAATVIRLRGDVCTNGASGQSTTRRGPPDRKRMRVPVRTTPALPSLCWCDRRARSADSEVGCEHIEIGKVDDAVVVEVRRLPGSAAQTEVRRQHVDAERFTKPSSNTSLSQIT